MGRDGVWTADRVGRDGALLHFQPLTRALIALTDWHHLVLLRVTEGNGRGVEELCTPDVQGGSGEGTHPPTEGLQTEERVGAVTGIDVIQVDPTALHLCEHPEWELVEALQFHDVQFAPQVLGQVPVDPESHLAVTALEGSRVVIRWGPESLVHVDFVVVTDGTLVLLEVSFRSEGHST